jgi:hypothetical protein
MVFMMFGSLSAGLFAAGLWFWQMLITFAVISNTNCHKEAMVIPF